MKSLVSLLINKVTAQIILDKNKANRPDNLSKIIEIRTFFMPK